MNSLFCFAKVSRSKHNVNECVKCIYVRIVVGVQVNALHHILRQTCVIAELRNGKIKISYVKLFQLIVIWFCERICSVEFIREFMTIRIE